MSPKLGSLDFQKLELVRSLFWAQFGKLMGFKDLIISIDETTINTGTHQAYGWSLKGKPREIGIVLVQGKLALFLLSFLMAHEYWNCRILIQTVIILWSLWMTCESIYLIRRSIYTKTFYYLSITRVIIKQVESWHACSLSLKMLSSFLHILHNSTQSSSFSGY